MPKPRVLPFGNKSDLEQAVTSLDAQPERSAGAGRHFDPKGDCGKCGKLLVPVSCLTRWLCSSCYEEVANTELGSAILQQIHNDDQARKARDYHGQQDDGAPRLKGWRTR